MLTLPVLASPLVLALACAPAPQALPRAGSVPEHAFEDLWYDGQAELDGYAWSGTRYGELRSGEAVAIFVTEPLGADDHVKVDRPDEHRGAVLTVLKLNLVRDFQTGIYDYNTMTSVFARVDDLAAVKVSFSSAEWCGHVFETLDARPRETTLAIESYFQGESQHAELAAHPDGLLGDHVLIWLRGLRGHALAAGETRRLPYLPDAFERRLRHSAAAWGTLTVTREPDTSVQMPAGAFEAVVYRLESSDGRTGRVLVESAYPHRLLAWSWVRGEELLDSGRLTGSKRMKYWELHGEGQESLRTELGLAPR